MERCLLLASLLAVASVAVATQADCSTRARQVDSTSLVRSGHGPYTYSDGPTGPKNWGRIGCPGYSKCASGAYQSPINIEATHYWRPRCRLNLQIESRRTALMGYRVAANDFSFQCKEPFWGCGNMRYRGRLYNLLQIHLHSPSEHTIDGARSPMEIHFVHQDPLDNSLAVLGAFIKVGSFNPHLESLFLAARLKGQQYAALKKLLAPIVRNPRPCTFMGSLTTPPCSEGVKWILSNTPLYASRDQIIAFRAMNDFMPNNRPRQSAQGRSIRCFLEKPRRNDKRPFCTNEHY